MGGQEAILGVIHTRLENHDNASRRCGDELDLKHSRQPAMLCSRLLQCAGLTAFVCLAQAAQFVWIG